MVRDLEGRDLRSMIAVALKKTGPRGIYVFLHLYTYDTITESISLGVISEDSFSLKLYCPFHPSGHKVLSIPKRYCRGKRSKVCGYCRDRHAFVYGVIPQDCDIIYEVVVGSNSGLPDSPVFSKI